MAITTQDGLVNGLISGPRLPVSKAAVTSTAARLTSLWSAAGTPGVGSVTLGQTAAGEVPTSASVGALTFANANNSHLGRMTGLSTVTTGGLLILYDILWVWGSGGSGWNVTTTTAQSTTAPAALTRPDANGVGCELWMEVLAVMGAGAATPVATYTNSANTGSRTTQASTYASTAAIGSVFPMPLQAGDTGIKSVQSVTLTTSTTTGTARFMIVKRIAEIPMVPNVGFTQDAFALGIPRVYDNACIGMSVLPASTSTGLLMATAVLAQG